MPFVTKTFTRKVRLPWWKRWWTGQEFIIEPYEKLVWEDRKKPVVQEKHANAVKVYEGRSSPIKPAASLPKPKDYSAYMPSSRRTETEEQVDTFAAALLGTVVGNMISAAESECKAPSPPPFESGGGGDFGGGGADSSWDSGSDSSYSSSDSGSSSTD